jgi:hypothetical protein
MEQNIIKCDKCGYNYSDHSDCYLCCQNCRQDNGGYSCQDLEDIKNRQEEMFWIKFCRDKPDVIY